ncbi:MULTISPECIES: BON domain-containing protein [unclassified Variovorax]|uniref:BON domain-containing protein n=1 Tax=unclassified Variovorax TaxID=663243 RepID=UPI0025779DA5|nr:MULTISPECIES: BON domain-containing protein [unclassified Variovorax]MDM0091124.1 BON domain-containing protein [Variovorax sp. J22G40]MDM0148874.1 BON domain-containing protein [Variovorax sp. J2P1-31]
MKTSSIPRLVLTLTAGAALAAALSACVPLVVGGAAVGAGLVATDRRTSGAQLDDQGIELRAASRIREIANDQMYVSVTSFNRQMLLTGTVGNADDRRRAEAAVQGVDNVRNVVNEIQVGPSRSFQQRSNDTFITGKVKASLLDAKDLFANSFKIVTDSGVVYLMGLATRREIDRATDITRGVSGVQKVVRVVEVITEAELANQATSGGTQQNTAPAASSNSSSRVPLPPMEPLKTAPATGGATVSPVR